jgi:hypothetical protein
MKLGNIVLIALGGVVVYLWAKNRKSVAPAATTPAVEPWWRSGKYKQEQVIKYVLTRLGKTEDLISWAPGTPVSVINENTILMGVNRGILVPSIESEEAFMAWLKGGGVKEAILSNIPVSRPIPPSRIGGTRLVRPSDSNEPIIVNTSTGRPPVSSGLKPATML